MGVGGGVEGGKKSEKRSTDFEDDLGNKLLGFYGRNKGDIKEFKHAGTDSDRRH